MGFGTGHHPTTRLVLRALRNCLLDDRTVLDIGCGSGVLAIAAVGLGARTAVGIDIDPDALANARENVELNGVADARGFERSGLPRDISRSGRRDGEFDGRIARANGRISCEHRRHQAGHLIVSGFMESEKDAVVPALERFLRLQTIAQEEEWMCAVFADLEVGAT